jgi:hypothetical protein
MTSQTNFKIDSNLISLMQVSEFDLDILHKKCQPKILSTMRLASSVMTMTPSVGQRRPSQSNVACFLLIAWSFCGASAFVSTSGCRLHAQKQCRGIPFLAQNSDDEGETTGFPQLPPSSMRSRQDQQTNLDIISSESIDNIPPAPFVMNRKFELQYTCNVCETRNSHSVSRVACE